MSTSASYNMGVSDGWNNLVGKSTGTDQDSFKCFGLTYKQRIIGFACCFVAGALISFVSTFTVFNIKRFAVLYSLGNIVALCGTGFLVGPCRQLKNMFHKKRVITTIVYLTFLILTLVVAFATGNIPLTLLCLVIQFAAFMWYCLSYIPFGRKMAKNCMTSCCS